MKRLNYFEHNGKRYYTGTIFVMQLGIHTLEGTFVAYIPECDRYVYRSMESSGRYEQTFVSGKDFYNRLVSVTNKTNPLVSFPQEKQFKDRHIDGLPLGWLWYIFLMAISTLFKDAIGLWILITVVFFNWRKKKIKEEGTYVEW